MKTSALIITPIAVDNKTCAAMFFNLDAVQSAMAELARGVNHAS